MILAVDIDLVEQGRAKLAEAELIPLLNPDLGAVVEAQLRGPNRQANAALIVWLLNHARALLHAEENVA